MLTSVINACLLAFGFGFVIFWHELGHFLAMRWAGVRVEQFAVGMFHAVGSYRKGMGVKLGSTRAEYEHRTAERLELDGVLPTGPDGTFTEYQRSQAAAKLGLSETEYRLNWLPLGGYVKPTGQDDLRPAAVVKNDDPHNYNAVPVAKRMVIVSAGVVMNIILAAAGFMVVFWVGFSAPPPVVGAVLPGSPAQHAGLSVGDRLLTLDGRPQYDFTKISLHTALLHADRAVPITYRTPAGEERGSEIRPLKQDTGKSSDFLMLGIGSPSELRGLDAKDLDADAAAHPDSLPPETLLVGPGETITAVNGMPVGLKDIALLDSAVQASGGKPVMLTVRTASGVSADRPAHPRLAQPFSGEGLNFAGLQPRATIEAINADSSASGKLMPGDVVLAIATAGPNVDAIGNPTDEELRDFIGKASDAGQKLNFTVLRGEQTMHVDGLTANVRIEPGRHGLGVQLGDDEGHAVAAASVPGSPAAAAKVPAGFTIDAVNGTPVRTWFDLREVLAKLPDNAAVTLAGSLEGQPVPPINLGKLSPDQLASARDARYTLNVLLHAMVDPRKAPNPIVAVKWGLDETLDSLEQVYLTVRGMFEHSIPVKAVSGPLGIFTAGYRVAAKGPVWLLWFLSVIGANLAVMNFLPIPIVDGGLFTFLIIEKIKGGPVSPRVQAVAQIVGLALLGGVFIFATYQDILRSWF